MLVFDCDQTLIDSTIRENMARCHKTGALNLPDYIRLKSLVSLDTVLPLGQAFCELKAKKLLLPTDWRILTARTFDARDYTSLAFLLGLTADDFSRRVIHRENIGKHGGNGDEQESGLYKKPVLARLSGFFGGLKMVDDCPSVLALKGNFQTVNAYDFYGWTVTDCKRWILANC